VVVGAFVVIALLLLAWLPRSGLLDPPAGQSERPRPASPTTVTSVGGTSPGEQATADEQGKRNDGKGNGGQDKGDEDD
jgi:hypothetical protein